MDNPETKPDNLPNQSSRKGVLIFLLAAVLVIAGLSVWQNRTLFLNKQAQPTNQASSSNAALDAAKSVLNSKEKLTLPTSTVLSTIDVGTLPADLTHLILSGATGTSAQQGATSDGKKQYRVSYKLENADFVKTNVSIYAAFQKGWQPLSGLRSDLYAIREVSSPALNIQIFQSRDSTQSSAPISVTINAVEK